MVGKVRVKPQPTIDASFRAHLAAHPEFYRRLVAVSQELHGQGWRGISFEIVWHRVKSEWMFARTWDEQNRLRPLCRAPNSYRSRACRWILSQHPEMDGLFRLSSLRRE